MGDEVVLGGSGSGKGPTGRAVNGLKMALPNVVLERQTAIFVPWQELPVYEDEREVSFDGIIGYDIFKRYVVELDSERGLMTLH